MAAATTQQKSNSRLAVRLPDGRVIRMEHPPASVLRAAKRLLAAHRAGVPAGSGSTAVDAVTVIAWLETQEDRHPSGPGRGWVA